MWRSYGRAIAATAAAILLIAGLSTCVEPANCESSQSFPITASQFAHATAEWPIPSDECAMLCSPFKGAAAQLSACVVVPAASGSASNMVQCFPENLCTPVIPIAERLPGGCCPG
jgi:hypothetical protein